MADFDLIKLADSYYEKGNLFDAEKLYLDILKANPKNTHAIYQLAYISVIKLDYENAELLLDSALKLNPDIKILKLLAYVKEKRFELYDAIVMYEQVLELEPTEDLYIIIGNLYISLELYDNAIHLAKEYIEKYPTIIAYRRLFILYLNLSMNVQLKNLCDEIKSKFPNNGLTYNLMGMYKEFIETSYAEAETMYEKSAKLGTSTAAFDLALCHKRLKNYTDSEKWAKKALDIYPNKSDVVNLLAELSFVQKKMRKGFKYLIDDKNSKNEILKKLKNGWDGKAYPNKTILVYCDGTNSDVIRNLRFIQPLNQKFKNVILACPTEFIQLCETNNINTVKIDEISKIKYDKYVLISQLPYYLNIGFENIPDSKGYLKSDKKDIKGLNIGLLWKPQGDSIKVVNQQTIDITKYLKELFEIDEVQYYSFQKNDIFNSLSVYPRIVDIASDLSNYSDYAEYIKGMDLIISIDSDIIHLAGALGVPTLAILPYDSDWYWFDNDKKTEWYSSIEIVRRGFNEDWTEVSEKITEKVKALAKHNG